MLTQLSPQAHPTASPLHLLHAAFLSILPRIELHGRVCFRGLKCPHRREDAIAEVVALAWKWFVGLVEQGKDPLAFPATLATFAARQVKRGRRLCGQEKGQDVLSPHAQQRHSFTVERLPSSITPVHGTVRGRKKHDVFEERLRDNRLTPVPEQAAFRIDFPAWLHTLAARERHLVRAMAGNERTKDLSAKFALSPGRISQMRRELHNGWTVFCGERESATQHQSDGSE
jgi:hypothetical protein